MPANRPAGAARNATDLPAWVRCAWQCAQAFGGQLLRRREMRRQRRAILRGTACG